jgi:flagellar motor component MotA
MGQVFLSVMDALVRLMTPLRREFNFSLDAQRYVSDKDYADSVLRMTLSSQQESVKEMALYLSSEMKKVAKEKNSALASQPTQQPVNRVEEIGDLEAQARAKMMEKYRQKLR